MSEVDTKRCLFSELEKRGLFEYGSVIPTTLVRELLGIKYPEVASKAVFDTLSMLELSAIDYCRNILLGHGKYLTGTKHGYRVLLPSENRAQVDAYVSSADRKLSRALKLSRNTPKEADNKADQTEVRLLMKRDGMRRYTSPRAQLPAGAANG